MVKTCNVCKESKNISEFYSRKKGKYGVAAQCIECVSNIGKQYYIANKEKVDAKNKKNKANNRERYNAVVSEWGKKNRERRNACARERYKKNSKKENERSKRYFESNPEYRFEYYRENKDHLDSLTKNWKLANKGKFTEYTAKRRASKLNASIKCEGDAEKIEQVYKERARLTKENGVVYEVDHIVPLQGKTVCGLHVSWNLQILTQTENRRKRNLLDASVNISRGESSPEE